jgi:glycosyltransferase involved in cell wall biosynthesis
MDTDRIEAARRLFDARYPGFVLSPVVALVCAYNEADNIGAVLAGVPDSAGGLAVTTLVVVDGGDDGTDKVALEAGAITFVLAENVGHGAALQIGYRLCIEGGARYVVTLDADGQNDPAELPTMLAPLLEDQADFVLASRRLGRDQTKDRMRKAGVRVYGAAINALTGAHLTDTSNGYRGLRVTMLADVVDRLCQPQYQTAELLITALKRGWRVVERPTVWHERSSGQSKKGSNLMFGLRYGRVIAATWWRER